MGLSEAEVDGQKGWYDSSSQEFLPASRWKKAEVDGKIGLFDPSSNEFQPLDVVAPNAVPPAKVNGTADPNVKMNPINEALVKRGVNIENILTPSSEESFLQTIKNVPGRALDVTGQAAGLINDVGGELIKGFLSATTGSLVKQDLKAAGQWVLSTELGKKGLEALKGGVESYQAFKKDNPETARHLAETR